MTVLDKLNHLADSLGIEIHAPAGGFCYVIRQPFSAGGNRIVNKYVLGRYCLEGGAHIECVLGTNAAEAEAALRRIAAR